MGYYQGGDYATYGYGGDPGLLSSIWKGVKAVGRFAMGIPPAAAPPMRAARPPPMRAPKGRPPSFPGGLGGGRRPKRLGVSPEFGPPGPARVDLLPVDGCCPPGHHISKTTGMCVRNRRMNVTNSKALRRAIRRVDGFGRLAKRMGYVKRSTRRRSTK